MTVFVLAPVMVSVDMDLTIPLSAAAGHSASQLAAEDAVLFDLLKTDVKVNFVFTIIYVENVLPQCSELCLCVRVQGKKCPKKCSKCRGVGAGYPQHFCHHPTANIYKETKLVSKSTEWSSYSGQ